MGLKKGLPLLLLSSLLVLLPAIHCSPQYSGKKFTDLDDGTLSDIFGSSMDSARYGNDDEEWIEVPITLLPGDRDCQPLQQPRKEPEMMKLHEEFRQIEVIKATGNNKCDFYQKTEGFECVPYYQCDDGKIITDGYGLIDIRFGGSDDDGPELAVLDSTDLMCPGSLDVCCKDPDFEKPKPQKPPEQKPEPVPDQKPEPGPKSLPFESRCGRRNSFGLGVRIQNYKDDEAQFGEWPHMCAILRREIIGGGGDGYAQQEAEEEVMVFQAGASLIAAGVVLTGAHKVQDFAADPSSLVVRCGEWDTQTEGEPLAHQDRNVRLVELNPEFNKGNLVNTVALLFLETEFELADHIDTICLPEYQEKFEDRQECFVKGWGKDTFGKDAEYQVVLKEVALPVVPRDQCLNWLRATRLGRRFKLDKSFLCAGGEAGKDACRGDGGGPLVCPQKDDPEHYTQVGIVAWGIGCGEENVPSVYTDLSEQVCWIDWAMACQLKDKYVLRYGQECNDWLHKKQAHRFPPVRNIYEGCNITWPTAAAQLITFQQFFVDTIEVPYNLLIPKQEASITYASTSFTSTPLNHNQRIFAEQTLLRPSATSWPTNGYTGLYAIILADVSIGDSHSAIQWIVTNIRGNNIGGGDEIMEYVTPIAWRNCFNNLTNHGELCTGQGLINQPDYVHRNVLYVFKQMGGRVTVQNGERNTGCQLNLQSTISDTGTWSFANLTTFTTKYNLELDAATWFTMPYSTMVGRVLCRYHQCYGNTLSAFLAPTFFPNTTTTLPGITDLAICGAQVSYTKNGSHPMSVDSGDRSPIDWRKIL